MDCEREMLDQLHEMANATADFMTKPYGLRRSPVWPLAQTLQRRLCCESMSTDIIDQAETNALVGLGKGVIDAASQEGFPGVVTTLIEGIRTGLPGFVNGQHWHNPD